MYKKKLEKVASSHDETTFQTKTIMNTYKWLYQNPLGTTDQETIMNTHTIKTTKIMFLYSPPSPHSGAIGSLLVFFLNLNCG